MNHNPDKSQNTIKVVNHFRATTDPAANPHARIEMQIPRVARLHVKVESERVGLGIDIVGLSRIVELLQDISGSDAPTFHPDGDECRRVIVGLEEEVGVDVGGEVLGAELLVLSARLGMFSLLPSSERKEFE